MQWVSIIIFTLISLLNVYFYKSGQGITEKIAGFISKLLIIPALFFIYLISGVNFSLLLAGALLACWCGDIVLGIPDIGINKTQNNSLAAKSIGLICFLANHILCSALFLQYSVPGEKMIFLAPLYLVYLFYCLIFFPRLNLKGILAAGVIIYMLGVTFMSFTCLLLLIHKPGLPGLLLFIGSLFFIISDSILGYSYFVRKHAQSERIVMGSYISAQLFIVTGYILLLK